MKIIIKFSSEITIKSRFVRSVFSKTLTKNIKIILKNNHSLATIKCYWDYIEVIHKTHDYLQISQILMNIPGIHHFLLVRDSIINSLEDIYNEIMLKNYTQLLGKSFCIRVKRCGNHVYNSQEIESYLGNKLRHNIRGTYVNLTKPDETIYLEIKNKNLFIIIKRYQGLGGLPVGTQQECLSLISGGFDSPVASYMMIRRGCKVHYCFFNLFNNIFHTIEVYKLIYYLWHKFSSSHRIRIVVINFAEVINIISSNVRQDYIGIILKRVMIRTATIIANNWNIKALITGEVLGQVSSQTLDNLVLINNINLSGCLIFRPLITCDKEKIIALARQIGTDFFSKNVPEYCGMISKKSTIKADKKCLESEEEKCNLFNINKVVEQSYIIDVHKIPKFIMNQQYSQIDIKKNLDSTDIILDIRTKYEQDKNPLQIPFTIVIKKIPFYQLIDQFPKLDQNKMYLLYCEHGIMSKLQAMHLHQQGFRNIKIYRSSIKSNIDMCKK